MEERWNEEARRQAKGIRGRAAGSSSLPNGQSRDPHEIEESIRHTRDQMGETVSELRERLSGEHIRAEASRAIRTAATGQVDQMTRTVRHTAQQARSGVMGTIRENPIPSAMVALGLGWMVMESRRQSTEGPQREAYAHQGTRRARRYDYASGETAYGPEARYGEHMGERSRTEEMTEEARERASDMAHRAEDTARDVAHRAQREVDEMAEMAQERVQRARSGFEQMIEENPLLVGAAVLAAGAAIGFALPRTQVEEEYFGHAGEAIVGRAQDSARRAAKDVGKQAIRRAADAAEHKLDET